MLLHWLIDGIIGQDSQAMRIVPIKEKPYFDRLVIACARRLMIWSI